MLLAADAGGGWLAASAAAAGAVACDREQGKGVYAAYCQPHLAQPTAAGHCAFVGCTAALAVLCYAVVTLPVSPTPHGGSVGTGVASVQLARAWWATSTQCQAGSAPTRLPAKACQASQIPWHSSGPVALCRLGRGPRGSRKATPWYQSQVATAAACQESKHSRAGPHLRLRRRGGGKLHNSRGRSWRRALQGGPRQPGVKACQVSIKLCRAQHAV